MTIDVEALIKQCLAEGEGRPEQNGKGRFMVRVVVETEDKTVIADYLMNHNSQGERRVMGEQIRYAFEAGQSVLTYPQ